MLIALPRVKGYLNIYVIRLSKVPLIAEFKLMLYHLASLFKSYGTFFNVFHYVSMRAICALLSSMVLSLTIGNWFIEKSKVLFRAKAREWTPETHRAKDDMPTMGGLLILLVVGVSALLWCNLADPRVWIFLLCVLGFGAIGFWDDWSKVKHKKGISAKAKSRLQILMGLIIGTLLVATHVIQTSVVFPFFKNLQPDIGVFFILWVAFILVGCSNAVNLTDGLDGLAIGSLVPNFATYALICYLAGHATFAWYLHIPFAASAEMAVLGGALVGASLGFLWYNAYPAQIFMGDVGSLALGSGLALMAIMSKQELLLPISGGLFVLETVSVMMQVISYRYWGKRIFKMAPIHHHFELLGWPEAKITVRFVIISLVLCLLALITLKLR